ncbi:MAG: response regulator [Eubacteriales bacterium]|nr:response regulator [Eubacteriales bacterium]
MYTVLIADDEESVLEVLRTSIDWQALGVETLLTAPDGCAALEQLGHRTVDLLIADIQMPRMDGITLIKKVRKLSPETHCIVLTAYGEFTYAQQAIRLGVENYLLKPIVKTEIEQTVQSALDNLHRKRQSSDKLLRENTLRRWATGNIGNEELSDRATVLNINIYQFFYCVLCMAKRENRSISVFRSALIERLSPDYEINRYWDEKGRNIVILGGESMDQERLTGAITEAARATGAENALTVAIGTPVTAAENLHQSWQTAVDAIELCNLQTAGLILTTSREENFSRYDPLAEQIGALFYLTDGPKRQAGFQRVATKLTKKHWSPERGTPLIHACIQVLVEAFPSREGIQERIYREAAPDRFPAEAEAAAEAIAAFLEKVWVLFAENFERYSPAVQWTIRYIRERIQRGEGVALREMCAQDGMNPTYLGHVFKEETGLFFNDYLNRRRVQRGAVLLHDQSRRIKDVAEEVGFAYTSYFIKCFRNYKGVSPTAYRQSLLGQREEHQ